MSLVTPACQLAFTNSCLHSPAGCLESVTLPHKAEHEAGCQYREVICQYEHHGCQISLTVKVKEHRHCVTISQKSYKSVVQLQDMFWHNKMCSLRYHPHQNILPKMPCEKPKSPVQGSEIHLVEGVTL